MYESVCLLSLFTPDAQKMKEYEKQQRKHKVGNTIIVVPEKALQMPAVDTVPYRHSLDSEKWIFACIILLLCVCRQSWRS